MKKTTAGNIDAEYWFCGVEEERKKGEQNSTYRNIAKIVFALKLFKEGLFNVHAICKLLPDGAREYHKKELFSGDGQTFLMNLYPLDSSRAWCRDNWFLEMRQIFFASKAKAILCFGNRHGEDFLSLFEARLRDCEGGGLGGANFPIWHLRKKSKDIVISPSLGIGGINDNLTLVELAQYLYHVLRYHQ